MDKFVGKRLDGRYEIKEIIGVGGMAVVYKAHDNLENKTVAIKILKEEFVSNEEFLRRFKNESKAIAMLSHPNIVNVYDVSFGDLIQYIVMEYIEGITLKEFIEHEGSLRWKDAVHFTIQILKALQHAHDKGIVHRDVKPQNIMVLSDGTIKVTDFGIARFARSEQRTMTDKAIGSVHYISPEQARGEKTDEKADIYSVGVILYEMLTGRMPFQAESAVSVAIMQLQRDPQLPTEINGSIPLGLEQITMHAMQKTPERRYQSSAEMLCDLGQFRKDPSLTFEYPYFIDSSPTKFVGGVGVEEEVKTAKEPEAREKNNIIPILAGVATAFVIALVVLLVTTFSQWKTGDEIKCPDFVGKTLSEIKDNEEYKENFKFEEKWEFHEDYDYGIVYEQSKTDGENLKKGAKIILYVSKGQSTRKVPDVSGKTEAAAVSELKSNGFKTKIVEIADEDTEKGLVVKTDPARTTTVAEGAEITVYISTGKPIKNAKVPDVVGLEKADAEKEIKDEGFVPEIVEKAIYFKDRYYPIGYVFAQEPAKSSEELPEGSTVKIYVCSGYEFDVEFELPSDLKDGKYTIELYDESGKMIHKGDTISSAAVHGKYKTEKVVTKRENLIVTIMLDDGEELYKLYDFSIDNKSGKSSKWKEYGNDSYPKESDLDDTNNNSSEANG